MPRYLAKTESPHQHEHEGAKESPKRWKNFSLAKSKGEGEKPSTTPAKKDNSEKNFKRAFSLSLPSKKKAPKSSPTSTFTFLPVPIPVAMPGLVPTFTTSTTSPPTTPSKRPKPPRNRTISLRSVRSISSFMQHSRSTSSTSTPSSQSIAIPPESPSPMKVQLPQKVADKVRTSIRRLSSNLHLPHVTKLRGRDRSGSASSVEEEISHAPSPLPSPDIRPLPIREVHFNDELEATDYLNLNCNAPLTPVDEMPLSAVTEQQQQQPSTLMDTSVYVESEDVPDPFLIDEEGDALSEEEKEQEEHQTYVAPSVASSEPPAHEISLSATTSPILSPVNLNKDVPPPPAEEHLKEEEVEEEEEEIPDLYLPGLLTPTMFLPIPNTDPLTILLTKYIYPPDKRPMRDVTGDWKRSDIHTLVMTNSWRALARMARDRIVVCNPSDIETILQLWYLRLSSLARLRLSNQTAAECTNLFAVLNAIEPIEARQFVFERLLPFELEVIHARVKYWAGDHMGYLDALSALLRKCQKKAREAGLNKNRNGNKKEIEVEDVRVMWKERGARLCLILASQMVEMKDFTAATKLLEPLCIQSTTGSESNLTTTNPTLRSAIARIYIQGGNVEQAFYHFSIVSQDPNADESLKKMNEALLNAAMGDWEKSSEVLKELIENDAENYVAVNNLGVALLNQGKLKEAIITLEKAFKTSPTTVVVAEPFLFNLSTLYELRSAAGLEKKKDLLIEVAKWSGDGLRTGCLKMPTN